MPSEVKKREVLQLLKEYRAFWSAFGGAMPVDETGVRDAAFGPAGYIEAGCEYTKAQAEGLKASYLWLARMLALLLVEDFDAWASLTRPYLSDPADPSILAHWRRVGRAEDVEAHDRAIARLAEIAEELEIEFYVVWPKPMSEAENMSVEQRDREIVATYRRLKATGSTAAAKAQVAKFFAITFDAVEKVLEMAPVVDPDVCVAKDCGRAPYQQHLCVKHYTQEYRARKRRAG